MAFFEFSHIESTWLINMTNLTYSSQCNSWRPGRSDDKGLSSLPTSLYKRKFEEFSMNGGPGFNKKNSPHLCDEFPYSAIQLQAAISLWKSSGFLVLRSENIQLPEDESSGSCILPGLPSKYFQPHLGNRRRFQPACCFTAGKSDARRNLLQPVTEFTSVQRIQTKLTPIFSNGCV